MGMHVAFGREETHIHTLRELALLLSLLSLLLVNLASLLPLFDSSPEILLPTPSSWILIATRPLLRWDVFHFAHIASRGYVYEYEWAFLPGSPLIMRTIFNLICFIKSLVTGREEQLTWEGLLLGGLLAALLCGSTTTLYQLTLHHTKSPNAAFLASLLSLLPSSPATLRLAPSTEPFFTYLSYRGMLYCAHAQWLLATCCFALASAFRSNGVILAGFIIWGMLIEPFLTSRKVTVRNLLYSVLLTAVIFLPFVWSQYTAYLAFCTAATPAPWCSNIPPLIYGYVQAKYWNVGFLRYWTLQQLPNFVIAAPPLALLLASSTHYLRHALLPRLRTSLSPSSKSATKPETPFLSPFLSPSIAPHAIHALAITLMLLFSAHTQIVLRLAASTPFTYWAAAWLLVEHPRWGKYWVGWSVVWGATSIVLWATFLPPA